MGKNAFSVARRLHRGPVLSVAMTRAQALRQERQVQWLREATRAQKREYARDEADPRNLIPARCPACGLHLLGVGA